MSACGLTLVAVAMGLVFGGSLGFALSRGRAGRSRSAAVALVGYLTFGIALALLATAAFHLHRLLPFALHVHPIDLAVSGLLWCQLEVGCIAWTTGTLPPFIFLGAFALTQGSIRLLYRRLRARVDPEATANLRALVPMPEADLLVVRNSAADAFSFALLRADRRRGLRARSTIVVTSGLVNLLGPDEIRASVAHEMAHVRARDDRYLPFFRGLSTTLFVDPVSRYLYHRISRRHEFEADREAAVRTGRPRELACALLKVYMHNRTVTNATPFSGGSPSELLDRIEALLALDAAGTVRKGVPERDDEGAPLAHRHA